jgi:hypothetical protein
MNPGGYSTRPGSIYTGSCSYTFAAVPVRYDFRKRRSPEAQRLHELRPGDELTHDHSGHRSSFSSWLASRENEEGRKFAPKVIGDRKCKTYRVSHRRCPPREETLQALNSVPTWPKDRSERPRFGTEFNLVKQAFKYFDSEPFERNGVIFFPSFKEDAEFGDAMLRALLVAPDAPEWIEIAREMGIRLNDKNGNGQASRLLWQVMMFEAVERDHPIQQDQLADEARQVVRQRVIADRRLRYAVRKSVGLGEALGKTNEVKPRNASPSPPRLNYQSEQARLRSDTLKASCYDAAKVILRDSASRPLLTYRQFKGQLVERNLCEVRMTKSAATKTTRQNKETKTEARKVKTKKKPADVAAVASQLRKGLRLPTRSYYQGCTRLTLFDLSYVDADETTKRFRERQLRKMSPEEIDGLLFRSGRRPKT